MAVFFVLCLIVFVFLRRVGNVPLHPDTAEFVYPGMLASLGYSFDPCRTLVNHKWWKGSIIEYAFSIARFFSKGKAERRIFLPYPPYPYCELDPNRPIHTGGNPVVQQKMFVYFIHKWIGKWMMARLKSHAVVNGAVLGAMGLIAYSSLSQYVSPWIALLSSVLMLMALSLPFFDAFQVHAELYGSLTLLLVFFTVSKVYPSGGESSTVISIAAGFLIVFTSIFIKITYAAEAGVFVFLPLFVGKNEIFSSIIAGEIGGVVVIFAAFACTKYFTKLLHILNPFNLLRYRNSVPSMTRDGLENDSSGPVFRKRMSTIQWIYAHFGYLFNILTMCFLIWGLITGIFMSKNINAVFGFMFVWVLISLVVLKVQNKFYPSHFIPVLVPIFLLWGVTANDMLETIKGCSASPSGLLSLYAEAVLFFLLVLALCVVICFIRCLFFSDSTEYFLLPYLSRKNPHVLQLLVAPIIGDYLRKRAERDDRVFTFGYASTLYIYANKRASLEFLEGSLGVDPEISESVWGHSWKWWVCRDIHKFQPKYIVDLDGRLNVEAICMATGLEYASERIFYGCFAVYRLMDDRGAHERFGDPDGWCEHLVKHNSPLFKTRLLWNEKLFSRWRDCIRQMGINEKYKKNDKTLKHQIKA